jgi:hypothetical protein
VIAYTILIENLLGERPLGKPRREWEDSMEMDLMETGCEDGRWNGTPLY